MAAEIAAAVVAEIDGAFGPEASSKLQSGRLLQTMTRAYKTGHSAETVRSHLQPAVAFPLPVSHADLGLNVLHPVIYPSDYIRTLATTGNLVNLTGGKRLSSLALFWGRFQLLRPNHPVFELSESDRAYTVPIYLFADEGRGYKKTGIMILGYEPVLGFGCEAEDEKTSRDELKMNFVGNTYMTRMLFSVLPKTSYEKKDIRLHALVENLTMDLARCFETGLSVKVEGRDVLLRVVAIGLKGDWPALIKLGKLERHFTRESYPYGKGLCHLCQANTEMCHSWHECDFTTAPWVATMSTAPMPWTPTQESSLTKNLPMEVAFKPQFYLVDLFHTVHKGVHADLAGSAIVTWVML